ncbi:hypothetical protein NW753_007579 [Fusarium oxysporum]|nr:hypothetical protein NW753_007579 [Fusarium oxysporum]KAJ4062396.1 hypothetical protein NW763_005815 [Fusarium oxysporum]
MGKNSLEAKADIAMAEDAGHVVDEQILDLDQRIQELVAIAPPFYQNKNLLRLYLLIIPTCLAAAITLGFDASMMSGLQAVPSWDNYFGQPRGALLGIMSAILPLGCVVATPFISLVGDRWGRRMGIFVGAVIMIIGAVIQGASVHCNDEAKALLVKWHGNGDEDDELVKLEFIQMRNVIEAEVSNETGWKDLLTSPGNRKRVFILVCLGCFSQWSGNGLVSYYLVRVLETVGVTDAQERNILNGCLMIFNWLTSVASAFHNLVTEVNIAAMIDGKHRCQHVRCNELSWPINLFCPMSLKRHAFLLGPLILGLPWIGRNAIHADVHGGSARGAFTKSRGSMSYARFNHAVMLGYKGIVVDQFHHGRRDSRLRCVLQQDSPIALTCVR